MLLLGGVVWRGVCGVVYGVVLVKHIFIVYINSIHQ